MGGLLCTLPNKLIFIAPSRTTLEFSLLSCRLWVDENHLVRERTLGLPVPVSPPSGNMWKCTFSPWGRDFRNISWKAKSTWVVFRFSKVLSDENKRSWISLEVKRSKDILLFLAFRDCGKLFPSSQSQGEGQMGPSHPRPTAPGGKGGVYQVDVRGCWSQDRREGGTVAPFHVLSLLKAFLPAIHWSPLEKWEYAFDCMITQNWGHHKSQAYFWGKIRFFCEDIYYLGNSMWACDWFWDVTALSRLGLIFQRKNISEKE